METYSETIGRFAGELKLADVPPAVVEKAKLVFLDTLGIALASSTMDFGLMAINVARKLGGPKAAGFRYRGRGTPARGGPARQSRAAHRRAGLRWPAQGQWAGR